MDLRAIRQLIKMLAGTDVSEIEVREETHTIRITRYPVGKNEPLLTPQPTGTASAYITPPPTWTAAAAPAGAAPLPARDGAESAAATVKIQSPMVGTYYQANSPDAPPLVSRGDIVQKGQVVCIIEAMKLMNEIESEYTGRVVSLLKENASPVEYGEVLFILEPV
ncbi:MAG: acetyl-CoA carboxylase biotin carboxyl carrier protein [Magnetococcales bacterium]|nr:acetyl-CoA carboxylase biotin carboxyl carrier protein [Magnetococcales bacterium]